MTHAAGAEPHDTQSHDTLPRVAGPEYFPIAFLARLPFAMNVVGVLTLVVFARDSFALGGLTSAVCGIGTALVGPFLGAAADRYGQRVVLLAAAILNSLALLTMAWVAYAPVSEIVLLIVGFAVGATAPQVSPLSRSRLVSLISTRIPLARRPKVLSTTLAYESSVDEIVFVFGPVIVGFLAATMNPAAPLIGSAVLTLIAVGAFALHRTAKLPELPHGEVPRERAPASELFTTRVLVLVVGMLAIGFFFGATLTSLTGFMADRGMGEQAGVFYGIMGIGSAILALSVALLPGAFTLRWRWTIFASILVIGAALIAIAHDVPSMILGLAVAGIGVGPLIVTIYTFATMRTPFGRSATVMTMVSSGVVVGQSLSSAVVGTLIEDHGAAAAMITPPIAAALVLACALVNVPLSRRVRP